MNSFVLMAKIIRSPELRYTQDNQTAVAQMLVEFEGQKPEDPPTTLKVVGWGNLATEISEKYSEGDRVIIEGRLSMTVFERPEGYKEKRAELVISHIYSLDGTASSYTQTSTTTTPPKKEKVVEMNSYKNKTSEPVKEEVLEEPTYETNFSSPQPVAAGVEQDLDDIPF